MGFTCRRGGAVVFLLSAAGRRPAALGPRWADPALDLAAVRQPVLRVPLRSALALDPEKHAPRKASQGFAGYQLGF